MNQRSNLVFEASIALSTLAFSAFWAAAADLGGPTPAPSRVDWWKDVKITGHVEGGYTFNGANPADDLNFGHLFTDRSDVPLLNQFVLTLERPLDAKKGSEFQLGFKLQAMYGSDARYAHFLGEFDRQDHRNQFTIVEAFLNYHLPVLTKGRRRREDRTIRHPRRRRGHLCARELLLLALVHLQFRHSVHAHRDHDDHAREPDAGHLPGDRYGREHDLRQRWRQQRRHCLPRGHRLEFLERRSRHPRHDPYWARAAEKCGRVNPNEDLRYLNDITTIWKITKKLTSITDINYIRDEGLKAEGWGVAQYFTYQLNDQWALGVRGEIWRGWRPPMLASQRAPSERPVRIIKSVGHIGVNA